jgi:hypothetical protein
MTFLQLLTWQRAISRQYPHDDLRRTDASLFPAILDRHILPADP